MRLRWLVATFVVGGHACLLLLLVTERLHGADAEDARLAVFLVKLPPPSAPAARLPPADPNAPVRARAARPGAGPVAADADPGSVVPAIRPGVDWAREAERVAAEAARAPGAVPACEPSGRPDSKLPPCPARGEAFEWRREPRAVEFSGGLPFVRLGKRCAVGLGFFGCAIGTLPPANGQLFDGMQDADRERSSVPAPPRGARRSPIA